MTKLEHIWSHAARCDRLAEVCTDPAIAQKLRRLAQDYRNLAEEHLNAQAATSGGVVPPGSFYS
jgi:hypothetical protein